MACCLTPPGSKPFLGTRLIRQSWHGMHRSRIPQFGFRSWLWHHRLFDVVTTEAQPRPCVVTAMITNWVSIPSANLLCDFPVFKSNTCRPIRNECRFINDIFKLIFVWIFLATVRRQTIISTNFDLVTDGYVHHFIFDRCSCNSADYVLSLECAGMLTLSSNARNMKTIISFSVAASNMCSNNNKQKRIRTQKAPQKRYNLRSYGRGDPVAIPLNPILNPEPQPSCSTSVAPDVQQAASTRDEEVDRKGEVN